MLQFVVGDRFSSLSQDKLYITYSDFIKKTLSQTPSAIEHPFYMPAQGLNQGCRQKISNENARLNNKKNSDVIIMQSKDKQKTRRRIPLRNDGRTKMRGRRR